MPRRRGSDPRGKLKAVARNWAGGRGGTVSAEGDPLTQASADYIAARHPSDEAELGPDEDEVVRLFFTLSTQWRFDGMSGRRIGLDYNAIQPTAAMLGVTVGPDMLLDLRTMEAEALAVFAQRR